MFAKLHHADIEIIAVKIIGDHPPTTPTPSHTHPNPIVSGTFVTTFLFLNKWGAWGTEVTVYPHGTLCNANVQTCRSMLMCVKFHKPYAVIPTPFCVSEKHFSGQTHSLLSFPFQDLI